MPRICKSIGCRDRPAKGCYAFCREHYNPETSASPSTKCLVQSCLNPPANPKYKGYCQSCFVNLYPDEPLSFQTKYKTKQQAIHYFIQANFDGFIHPFPLFVSGCRIDYRIVIGTTLLCIHSEPDRQITYDELFAKMPSIQKVIVIVFNYNKYIDASTNTTINPMLYMRLPILEDEIAKQMENIVAKQNTDPIHIVRLFTSTNPSKSSQ